MKKFTKLELKWGIIFFIASLLWMYYEKLMGWHDENIASHASLTLLFLIPAVTIYIFALIDKRRNHYNDSMTWTQGFICGLHITLVVTILSPLGQYIIHTWISPDYFTNIIEYSVNSKGASRAEMEAYFSYNNYVVLSFMGAIIMGVITSAVVAIFVRKKSEH
jgi:hypothetical protein